jgi:hypothetical protein
MEPPLAPVRRLITERRAPSTPSGLKKKRRLIYVDAVTTGPTSRDGRVWPHEAQPKARMLTVRFAAQ